MPSADASGDLWAFAMNIFLGCLIAVALYIAVIAVIAHVTGLNELWRDEDGL